ncbi:MAG: Hpt domain-containing protein [Verrucomicrobiota bacterium]
MNSSSQPSWSPSSFDPVVALQRVGGDQELFGMAVELGISNLPKLIQRVVAARTAHDVRDLGDAAHTLKGMVATFEATELRQLAAKVEGIARSGKFEEAEKLVPELEEKAEVFSEELTEFADRLESGDCLSLSN